MNLNKYTEKAQEAVLAAQNLAESENHPQVEPEHLLLALVEQRDGVVPALLRKLQWIRPRSARAGTRSAQLPKVHGGSAASMSPRLKLVTDLAQAEAERLKDEYVSTEHLFIAIASEAGRSPAARLLKQAGLTRDRIFAGAHARPRQPARHRSEPRGQIPGARALRARPDRARAEGQARPGHRPRRGDPARDPGALPPHEEQPRPHRRARRRQDGRSSKAWHSASSAATCPKASRTRRSSRSTWARWWPARSTAASSRSG